MTERQADQRERTERPPAWQWPSFHHRVAQRDAAVARAEADGQIVTEPAPDDVTEEVAAEDARRASLPRAGGKLISAAPPVYDPTNDRDPRQARGATSASPVPDGTETATAPKGTRSRQDTPDPAAAAI